MYTAKITSNYVPRDLIGDHELTEKERAEFDYYTSAAHLDQSLFFKYRGQLYDLGEVMLMAGDYWHGAIAQCAWGGIVVHVCDDNERVIVGTQYSVAS